MKKTFLLFLLLFPIIALAESAKPSLGVKLERNVDIATIEGKTYNNVIVEIDAATYSSGVKITVKDAKDPKKKIYKKKYSQSYLYGFSNGTIEVGRGNILTQLTLYKSQYGNWIMDLKEKGIY